jgi:hypothetical protein
MRLFLNDKTMEEWSNGATEYLPDYPTGLYSLLIGVRCRFGDSQEEQIALLDTGAAWSFCREEIAHELGISSTDSIMPLKMSTRFGHIDGYLIKLNVTFVSIYGHDLCLEPTFFISSEWNGPNVLGWKTCIESIRLAIDPSRNMLFYGIYGQDSS